MLGTPPLTRRIFPGDDPPRAMTVIPDKGWRTVVA
jgi:hypothetical protein